MTKSNYVMKAKLNVYFVKQEGTSIWLNTEAAHLSPRCWTYI